MSNPYQQAMKQYQSIELESNVETASPHQLIDLLLQGARQHISLAKGHLERNLIKEKGENISKAINIIEGLKTCLDHEKGGEIADNLSKLYDYIEVILIKGNRHNDVATLEEANVLLTEIHEAWKKIKPAMAMNEQTTA